MRNTRPSPQIHARCIYVNSIAAFETCDKQNVKVVIMNWAGGNVGSPVRYFATKAISKGEELLVYPVLGAPARNWAHGHAPRSSRRNFPESPPRDSAVSGFDLKALVDE